MLVKKKGMVSRVITACIPSGLSIVIAIAAERKRNPRENAPMKSMIPKSETRTCIAVYPSKKTGLPVKAQKP
ncbi:hypothetical protein [Methanosarcina barkeri]|uniref:hypothetical protein n=1 Tax=Methanosarcina barkeri TaxID=2208 RepID=UPI001FB38321|nr:hypothetical protein [Methanosarcina barkeri]